MRIQLMNVVIGVGAGAVDEVMEWQDDQNGRTEPFKKWTDWTRVGLCALGYLGQAFNFFPVIATPLAQSEVTLTTKSVAGIIRGAGVTRRAGASSRLVSRRTTGGGSISQTTKPGFEEVRVY